MTRSPTEGLVRVALMNTQISRRGWVLRMTIASLLFFVASLLFSVRLFTQLSLMTGAGVAFFGIVAYFVGWLYLGRGVLMQHEATQRPPGALRPERLALYASLVAVVVGLILTGLEGGDLIFTQVGIPLQVVFGTVAIAHGALFIIQSRALQRNSAGLTVLGGGVFLLFVGGLALSVWEFGVFQVALVRELSIVGLVALFGGLGAIGYGVIASGWTQEYLYHARREA